jgi:ribosomal protein L37AE/L43A
MSWVQIGARIIGAVSDSGSRERTGGPTSTTAEVGVTPPGQSGEDAKAGVPRRSGEDAKAGGDAMICERCGKAEMYRMHAVWRCPECGFKTDCCGW